MKKLMTILLTATIISNSYSQAPIIQWQKSLGGSSNETAYCIQQTLDGGYIVAGSSESVDLEVTGNHGAIDYWIVKLDDTGGIQWEQCYGGNSDEVPYAILQTPDSGYIVAGGTSSSDTDEVLCTVEEWDYWVVKISPTGSIVWSSCFGGTGSGAYNVGWSIQNTLDEQYVVAGVTDAIDGQVTGNHGGMDYWVIKINDTGGIQWQKSLGGSGTENGYAVEQTTDGGYIVAGNSNSNDSQVTGNHGGYDMWIVKLNDTGAIQWEKSLGGAGDEWAYSIHQTSDGGYIVAGTSDSNSGQVTGNHGLVDYWIVKLDDTGGIQWEQSYGGSGTDDGYFVSPTSDSGGYIVAGGSNSNDSEVSGNHGSFDYWVAKLEVTPLSVPDYGNIRTANIKIAPNPTNGSILVSGAGDVNISVYNVFGQLMKQAGNSQTISIPELPTGMYFIRLSDANGMVIYQDKIIKN